MPFIERLVVVNEVHGNLLDEPLAVLALVQVLALLKPLDRARLAVHAAEEVGVLAELVANDLEDDLAHLVDEPARALALVLARVLQESRGRVEGGRDDRRGRILQEVAALHGHLDEEKAHLVQFVEKILGFLNAQIRALGHSEVVHELLLNLISVRLPEVVVCHEVNLELEELKEFNLLLGDLLGRDGSVSDLLGDHLGVQREDVLVLARKIHGSHAEHVNVLVLEHLTVVVRSDEVLVKKGDGQEVSSRLALEARRDLDHPVSHLGAELLRDFVALERVLDGSHGSGARELNRLAVGELGAAKLAAGIDELAALQGLLDVLQLVAVKAARISQALLVLMELSEALKLSSTLLSFVELLGALLDAVSLVEVLIGRGLVAHLDRGRVLEKISHRAASLRDGYFESAHVDRLKVCVAKVLRLLFLLRVESLSVDVPHGLVALRLSAGRARLVQNHVVLGLASLRLGIFRDFQILLVLAAPLNKARVLDGFDVNFAEVLCDVIFLRAVASKFTVQLAVGHLENGLELLSHEILFRNLDPVQILGLMILPALAVKREAGAEWARVAAHGVRLVA